LIINHTLNTQKQVDHEWNQRTHWKFHEFHAIEALLRLGAVGVDQGPPSPEDLFVDSLEFHGFKWISLAFKWIFMDFDGKLIG
jgi:hypothetical protein